MGCQFAVMSFPWKTNAKVIVLMSPKDGSSKYMVSIGISVDLYQKEVLLQTSWSQASLPWVRLKAINTFCGHITSYYLPIPVKKIVIKSVF
jgi:hypothetical protein